MKNYKILLALLLALSLFGCTTGAEKQATISPKATPIANPQPGKATVTGQMVKTGNGPAVSGNLVRLAKIYGEGSESIYIFSDSDSPGTYTDDEGYFVFEDIEPGLYAVLLMNQNSDYLTINESAEKILTVDAVVDEVTNIGQIPVDLSRPPQ